MPEEDGFESIWFRSCAEPISGLLQDKDTQPKNNPQKIPDFRF